MFNKTKDKNVNNLILKGIYMYIFFHSFPILIIFIILILIIILLFFFFFFLIKRLNFGEKSDIYLFKFFFFIK